MQICGSDVQREVLRQGCEVCRKKKTPGKSGNYLASVERTGPVLLRIMNS